MKTSKVLRCIIIYGITFHDNNVVSLQLSRRKILGKSVGWFVGGSASTASSCANAVAPITQRETETGMAKAQRLLRNNPPKLLRQKLSQEFAVLLMRTSYSIVDELDIVPMNQFQRDFFLIRTAEYEPYIQSLGPGYVTQGDLTDPSYFDFISFAQFLTINRVLSDPANVFEELQPVLTASTTATTSENSALDGGSTSSSVLQRFEPFVVRRTITNDQLIPTYNKKFGTTVLNYLDDTYSNTPIALTAASGNDNKRPSVENIQVSLTQLVKLFLINGFAWDGRVEVIFPPNQQRDTSDGTIDAVDVSFCIVLDSPASLWGNESLHRQRAMLTNDYVLIVAKEFIQQRTGYSVVSTSVKFQNNSEMSYLKLR